MASLADPQLVFSLEVQILRVRDFDGFPPVTFSEIGIGDPRPPQKYHSFLGGGGSELVEPVWDRFRVTSFAHDGRYGINYTFVGGPGVGLEDSTYSLTASGNATTRPGRHETPVAATLELVDERGVSLSVR